MGKNSQFCCFIKNLDNLRMYKIIVDTRRGSGKVYDIGRGNKATPINEDGIMLEKIFTVVVVGMALSVGVVATMANMILSSHGIG